MKKWFENFWYYYKWPTIIGAIILVCVLIGLNSVGKKEEYDLKILLMGKECANMESTSDKMSEAVSPYLSDITDDGNIRVFCRDLMMADKTDNDLTMIHHLVVDLSAGESRLFFIEEEYIGHFIEHEALLPLDDVANESLAETGYRDEDGTLVAVQITNQDLLKDMEIYVPEGTYIAVRTISPSESKKERIMREHENALSLFRELTK